MDHFSAREIQDLFRQEAERKTPRSPRGKVNKAVLTSPTEHEEQVMLIQHCKRMEVKYPALKLLYAIPNGGQRHLFVAKKLKAEGVKSGVPDLFLPVAKDGSHGLFIELKRCNRGTVSKTQKEWLEALTEQGYSCAVCHGWAEAWNVIEQYLKLKKDGKEDSPYVSLEEASCS